MGILATPYLLEFNPGDAMADICQQSNQPFRIRHIEWFGRRLGYFSTKGRRLEVITKANDIQSCDPCQRNIRVLEARANRGV
ncbi:MAG: hypothetical protein AAF745_13020, partial [Planctomycetota bacterium]